ncbi:uncharacterized, partial [Tachysurus ichikawai]
MISGVLKDSTEMRSGVMAIEMLPDQEDSNTFPSSSFSIVELIERGEQMAVISRGDVIFSQIVPNCFFL